MGLVSGALKDLEQDQVADQKRLSTGDDLEFGCRRGPLTAQMRDPNGAVHEDHLRRRGRSSRISSRSPSHPNPLSSSRALACIRTLSSNRKPSSTVARLVDRPDSIMARDNNS